MSRLLAGLVGGLVLSACAGTGPAPSPSVPSGSGPERDASSSGGLLSGILGSKAKPGQIGQCYSKNAPDAVIVYPGGWSRRVSRAETEDELLGGGGQSVATSGAVEPARAIRLTYPAAALSPPIEGICEVKFDLSRQGEPSRIVAACSDPLFAEEAERVVAENKFKPLRVNDSLARGINVVYPMKFCLAEE